MSAHIKSAVIWDASAQPVDIPTPNRHAFTVTIKASDGRWVQLTWYVGGEHGLDGHIGVTGYQGEGTNIPTVSLQLTLPGLVEEEAG